MSIETENQGVPGEDAPADSASTADPETALETERAALAAQNADLQNMLLRQRADFENFRRRTEKERLEQSEYSAMDAVRSLLPILDDFERALASPGADAEYARGMELIYQRTLDTLKKLGLEPLVSVGEKFDPHLHHAIEMVNREDAPDQTVLAEFQRGYSFKGRPLRAAMVKVAVR